MVRGEVVVDAETVCLPSIPWFAMHIPSNRHCLWCRNYESFTLGVHATRSLKERGAIPKTFIVTSPALLPHFETLLASIRRPEILLILYLASQEKMRFWLTTSERIFLGKGAYG